MCLRSRASPRRWHASESRASRSLRPSTCAASDLDDPDRSASFADLDRLIGLCLRRTRCGHFGLLVGQYVTLQSFGVAGRLARNAPSVGAALQDLAAYLRPARQRRLGRVADPRRPRHAQLRHPRAGHQALGPGLRPRRRRARQRHAPALRNRLAAGCGPAAAQAARGHPAVPGVLCRTTALRLDHGGRRVPRALPVAGDRRRGPAAAQAAVGECRRGHRPDGSAPARRRASHDPAAAADAAVLPRRGRAPPRAA